MKKNHSNLIWIVLLAGILLTACNSQNPEELLGGKSWELVSMGSKENPSQIITDSHVTIEFRFEDMQIGGIASCNNYFAGFEINEDALTISAAGSTMMYCSPEEVMAQEFAFLAALGEAHHFTIQNEQLIIDYGDEQILVFE